MTFHTFDQLAQWVAQVLEACKVPADDARRAAFLLVRSEARGFGTHGLTRLPSYVDRLLAGDFNPRPRQEHRVFPGGIVLDADGAMGFVAAPYAIDLALAALDTSATVLVSIQNCGHLGALGVHALQAAEAGALCVIGQRTPPLLALEGFAGPAIGHNPIAFACPVPGEAPVVFDMACSVAARGHILVAAREQQALPPGWALDAKGRPTTDANEALAGSLLPAGGHKGMGIAMLVECLAGALAATAQSLQLPADEIPLSGAVGGQSAFVWLVRPQAFTDADSFAGYMTRWTRHYVARGGAQARLPGQRGAQLEAQAREHGMGLPASVLQALQALGQRRGVPFPPPPDTHPAT